MRIVCVLSSLDLEDNNLYLKLKLLLGDSLKSDLTIRRKSLSSEHVKINFVSYKQEIGCISGAMIDIAIMSKDAPQEWYDFLKVKTACNNGLLLTM